MIVVPGEFVFLMNPHTGTRTLVEGFARAGLEVPKDRIHHVQFHQIPDNGLPRYAVLRETVDWAYAYYWYWYPNELDYFLTTFDYGKRWGPKGRLDIYDGYVDRYFRYEDGIENILAELGFPQPRKLPTLGHHNREKAAYFGSHSKAELEHAANLLRRKFATDHKKYQEVFGVLE